MKKNYTLKITLAMLVVVLVSLVSFVGVYKGRNLLKDYSYGKDLSKRQIISFTVSEKENQDNSENAVESNSEENAEIANEETTGEENAEGETVQENSEESKESEENKPAEENKTEAESEKDKEKKLKKAKDIVEKRLVEMNAEDFEVRIDENGNIQIEVPTDIDISNIGQIISEGKLEVKNTTSNETIIGSSGFKSATARLNTTSYAKPIVTLDLKFSNDAKNIFRTVNTKHTDEQGTESDATFAITLDGMTLYSDDASKFVASAKNGSLDLVLGQNDEGKELQKDYNSAKVIVALINNEELPVKYEYKNLQIIESSVNLKSIVIVACIIFAILFAYALFKFKGKAILPMLSIVGMVGTILLVIRYTNVRVTLFTILGLALVGLFNYILILNALKNDKSFVDNVKDIVRILIPCIIIAIVFCCSPYIQVSSLGMTMFWGSIIMVLYNLLITRVLINK